MNRSYTRCVQECEQIVHKVRTRVWTDRTQGAYKSMNRSYTRCVQEYEQIVHKVRTRVWTDCTQGASRLLVCTLMRWLRRKAVL
jgi:hypothetical protein